MSPLPYTKTQALKDLLALYNRLRLYCIGLEDAKAYEKVKAIIDKLVPVL